VNSGNYLDWMISNTPTVWWHDSADPAEIRHAMAHGAVGVTTNPYLASVALHRNREQWAAGINAVLEKNSRPEQKAEGLVRHAVLQAAEMYLPTFEQSGGKTGYVCAQVNPSRAGERNSMMAMARRFHAWAPNIAIKLPAVSAGLDVLEDCIAEGITACSTVSFTVPQVIEIAERCRAGRQRAIRGGIKPGRCFAVIMIGRLDDYLREVALDNKAPVRESDIRQAGLAVTKQTYRIFRERGYEATLMVAALRGSYHLTELAGAHLVMTMAPGAQPWFIDEDHPREERIGKEIPKEVLERLRLLPEFAKAYEPQGMKPSEFISYGATQRTLSQYIEAGWNLIESLG
jgi:transaldolase